MAEMAKHDPLLIPGFGLLGAGRFFSSRVLVWMNRAGLFGMKDWRWDLHDRLPMEYLKVRPERGWSAWPVYLTEICIALGAFGLIVRLFPLQDEEWPTTLAKHPRRMSSPA
jgi:hypothetical protein